MNFLLRPGKTLNAFKNVFTNFNNNLQKRHKKLKTATGKELVKLERLVVVKNQSKPNQSKLNLVSESIFRGALRFGRKGRSQGGYIDGPMGGYPVTLDGRGVDFIGHGREFVAQKPGGDAFVIPFETPDTIKDPGLTGKRISEALKGGFNLKEMSSGGWINGPESGYLASMTGGRPDFIGHGLEYISKDSIGNSMVIPFNSSGMTRANMELAHMAGFKLPDRLPSSTGYSPGGSSVSQAAGKDGMIFGSIGKAFSGAVKGIGNFFSGGSKSSSSGGGGGGGGFFSSIASGIGNLFGGGSKSSSGSGGGYGGGLKTSGLDFGSAFSAGGYGVSADFENSYTTGSSSMPTFNFGNIFGGGQKRYRSGDATSGIGPLASGTQYFNAYW